jgi:hypothetical protein
VVEIWPIILQNLPSHQDFNHSNNPTEMSRRIQLAEVTLSSSTATTNVLISMKRNEGQAVEGIWHQEPKGIKVWVMGLTIPTPYQKMVDRYSTRLQRQRHLVCLDTFNYRALQVLQHGRRVEGLIAGDLVDATCHVRTFYCLWP